MRSILRWSGGFAVATTLAISLMPTSGALDIEGDLFWRDLARVDGVLSVRSATPFYYVQQVPAGHEETSYAWSMSAAQLVIYTSQRDERRESLLDAGEEPSRWENHTYEFEAATVRVALTPSRQHGATALYYADGAGASVQLTPAGSPFGVRLVDLDGDLMQVPDSARRDAEGTSYHYAAPAGRFLEVSGSYDATIAGDLSATFFGWTLTVEDAQERTQKFETGVRTHRDPTTGLRSGTTLEYVTLHAQAATLDLPALVEDAPFYTPLLRYSGTADYPQATYHGRHMEAAPRGTVLPIDGDIWLSAASPGVERHGAYAWGDAHWQLQALVPDAPAAPATAMPVMVSLVGLSLGTQLLPALARVSRLGLFLFYARLRDQEPNANPTRERIYEAIIAVPGLNLSRIVERLDIGWGTAAYHVQILKRQGRVRELRFLNRVCFFPSESPDETQQLQTVLLRQPNYREVMTVVEAQPGLSQREVAGRTGHARQYISRLVAKMERAGLLRTEPSRMGRRYFPATPAASREAPASDMPTQPAAPPKGPVV